MLHKNAAMTIESLVKEVGTTDNTIESAVYELVAQKIAVQLDNVVILASVVEEIKVLVANIEK